MKWKIQSHICVWSGGKCLSIYLILLVDSPSSKGDLSVRNSSCLVQFRCGQKGLLWQSEESVVVDPGSRNVRFCKSVHVPYVLIVKAMFKSVQY